MKQEDKKLLLQDISSRLPYGVKCIVTKSRTEEGQKGDVGKITCIGLEGVDCIDDTLFFSEFGNFKPYLFPLSSMTLEQRCKVRNLLPNNCDISFKNQKITFYNEGNIQLEQLEKIFHFFNLYHIDYRGLIPMGLALDATGLDVY